MKTLRTLFRDKRTAEERVELREKIFSVIASLREKRLKRQKRLSYAGLFLSGVAIVSAVSTYGGAFAQSEFWSIVPLFFSDILVVVNYWNEFSLLLLETIPVIPILLILVPTFIFLLFLNMYFKTRETHRFSY